MSNLHNLQEVVMEMTPYLHHVVQTKNKNRQAMEAKDICFCEKSFSNRSFLALEILREGICAPLWLHKPKKLMLNRVKIENFVFILFYFMI